MSDFCDRKPVLSVVVTARNDNHGGDQLGRMQIFINGVLEQSQKYQLRIELVIVEWNPPANKPRLADVLSLPAEHNHCTVRVIEVPAEIHNRYNHAQAMPLYQMVAKNVGIRRARGEFVLATNIDILFSSELFAYIASGQLQKNRIYRVDRYDADQNIPTKVDFDEQLQFCADHVIRINAQTWTRNLLTGDVHRTGAFAGTNLHTNGCGDFQLMCRDNWFQLHGYAEFDMYSFHLDSLLAYSAHFSGVIEKYLPDPMRIYHIEHSAGWTPESHKSGTLRGRLEVGKIKSMSDASLKGYVEKMTVEKKPIIFNDDDWGLCTEKLVENIPVRANWDMSNSNDQSNEKAEQDDTTADEGFKAFKRCLREKWREIPSTRTGRNFSSDMLAWSDNHLLEFWEECRRQTDNPEVRGWFQRLYKDKFSGLEMADIGPGLGIDGIFFAEHGAHVTFVDIVQDNLKLLARICKLKHIEADFYFIDNFFEFHFDRKFDVFLCIGSLHHTPFKYMQRQVQAMSKFLKVNGRVLMLAYPKERYIQSGAQDFTEFGKKTDGERTPWAEWYDDEKIQALFGPDFCLNWSRNFGRNNVDFNWFDLTKISADKTKQGMDLKDSDGNEKPYLSIVVTSRNDDHGGNTLHRMQVFAKGLAEQCKRFYLDAELIIVEWNPPADRKRLYEVLDWPVDLGPLAVRFIEVPPEIHNRIGNSDKFPLFQMIAKNVGIRRARGRFVLATNVDILFSDELIQFLAGPQLRENCFYRIDRHDVGCPRIPEGVGIDEQLGFCRNNLVRIQGLCGTKPISEIGADHFSYSSKDETKLHVNACGDFTLMAREKWHLFRGHPELPKWSIYVDGLLLHMPYVSGMKQVILSEPLRIYHIEHDTGWEVIHETMKKRPSLDLRKEYLPWCRRMKDEKRPITNNDENWGYAGMEFDEHVLSGRWKEPAEFEEVKLQDDNRRMFRKWIEKLSSVRNRLYQRDQTPESLNALVELVNHYKPTKIIELGTLWGFSLRAWLSAKSDAEIVAIDTSFKRLRESQQFLPVVLSGVRLLEQNILRVDFNQLWSGEDRVIFYVDAHDTPNAPIMEYVINNALPALPKGSVIAVDDLWYSPECLSNHNVLQFFNDVVINEVDPLQCFDGYYAPYWKGGSFFGFPEVVPLMKWVNQNRIGLVFKPGIKSVMFKWHLKSSLDIEFDVNAFEQLTGRFNYNPVGKITIHEDKTLAEDQHVLALCKEGSRLFATGKVDEANKCFHKTVNVSRNLSGVYYACAVCFAKSGRLDAAIEALQQELQNKYAHPNARNLLQDIEAFGEKRAVLAHGLAPQKRVRPVTLFAVPKAFEGHTGVIQRNAIKSWVLLEPRPEIILLGDDAGVAEVAAEFGARHIPKVGRNEHGTPLVSSVFELAEANSTTDWLVYVNCDVILMDDFVKAQRILPPALERLVMEKFLLTSQRRELDIREPIAFDDENWQVWLKNELLMRGALDSKGAVEMFFFSRGLFTDIPEFALGRFLWDSWLVWKAQNQGAAIIDAAEAFKLIHQAHDYGHAKGGHLSICTGPEAKHNQALSEKQNITVRQAGTHFLTEDGLFPGRLPDKADHKALIKLRLDRGRYELENENYQSALGYFDDALNRGGKSWPEIHFYRAKCLKNLGRLIEARQAAKIALAKEPENYETKLLLEQICDAIKEQNGPRANQLCVEGVQILRSSKPLEALGLFEEALSICPDVPNAHFAKATACVQLGKLGSAKEACQVELKIQPEHDGAKRLLERVEKAINEFTAIQREQLCRK